MRFGEPNDGMQVGRSSTRNEIQVPDKRTCEVFPSLIISRSINICVLKEYSIMAEDN
jgi:hypothetical protein